MGQTVGAQPRQRWPVPHRTRIAAPEASQLRYDPKLFPKPLKGQCQTDPPYTENLQTPWRAPVAPARFRRTVSESGPTYPLAPWHEVNPVVPGWRRRIDECDRLPSGSPPAAGIHIFQCE